MRLWHSPKQHCKLESVIKQRAEPTAAKPTADEREETSAKGVASVATLWKRVLACEPAEGASQQPAGEIVLCTDRRVTQQLRRALCCLAHQHPTKLNDHGSQSLEEVLRRALLVSVS